MNNTTVKVVMYIKSLTRLSDAVNRSFSNVEVYKVPHYLIDCAMYSVTALKEVSEARKFAKTLVFHKALRECLEHECDWARGMVDLCVDQYKRWPVIEYQIVEQQILDSPFSEQEREFIKSLYE